MLLESEKDREKRFKAMLQYLILREAGACEFENKVNSSVEDKAAYASKSAEKILKEMESKFFDLFVEDDLVDIFCLIKMLIKGILRAKKTNLKLKSKNRFQIK